MQDLGTTKFLRLADALHSYNALDRISYWLQPKMSNAAGCIVDTWGLSSIVLKCQQMLNIEIPFDCFHEHIANNEELALTTLNKLDMRMSSNGPLLCLVSISSSGRFLEKIRDIFERSNISNPPSIVSIYEFANSENKGESLACLESEIEWFDEMNCKYCMNPSTSKTYHIDPKFYYPKNYQESPTRFHTGLLRGDNENTSQAYKFINEFGRFPNVILVHKDDPNDGINPRHHAFYINVIAALENEHFKQLIKNKFNEITTDFCAPDFVITPPHQAGKLLAQFAVEAWKSEHIELPNLWNLSEEQKSKLSSAKHICFLDDVLISGTRIEGYLRSLREKFHGEELASLKQVTWFPIIVRPSDPKKIATIKDSLSNHPSWKNSFQYLYKIILPEWTGEEECPWCQDNVIFDREVGALWDDPVWYETLRSLLEHGKKQGINANPLFLLPGVARKTLGKGSPIGGEGSTEIQLLFLIAVGLQELRNHKKEPLGRDDILNSYVLFWEGQNQEYNTFIRYSEPLIQMAFLKCVKPYEWSKTVKSSGIQLIANKIPMGTHDLIIGELILFLHKIGFSGILPKEIQEAVTRICKHDKAVSLLINRYQDNV